MGLCTAASSGKDEASLAAAPYYGEKCFFSPAQHAW
jgi:hypothetical protein